MAHLVLPDIPIAIGTDPSAKPKSLSRFFEKPLFSPRTDNNLYFANLYFDK